MITDILKDMKQPASYLIYSIFVGLAIYLFVPSLRYRMGLKSGGWQYKISCFFAVVYSIILARMVYFSRPFHSRYGINMVIMGTWGTTPQSHAYVIENLILFMPFGILFPLCQPKKKTGIICILCACILSIFIETLQWITKRGYCELDDVIMNTLGAATGCGILYLFRIGKDYVNHKLWKKGMKQPALRIRKQKRRNRYGR